MHVRLYSPGEAGHEIALYLLVRGKATKKDGFSHHAAPTCSSHLSSHGPDMAKTLLYFVLLTYRA